MVYCLAGNDSILVHSVLLFDGVVYVLYALTFKHGWSKWVASACISANVFMVFLLSLMETLDTEIAWTWQVGGVATGALVGSLDAVGNILVLSDLAIESLLLLSVVIATNYVPMLLQSQYGLTQGAAQTLTLLLPLVAMWGILAFARSKAIRTLLRCVGLALLATATYILFVNAPGMQDTVCCDTSANGSCSVMPNTADAFLFLALAALLVLIVLYSTTRDFITWLKLRCCCCCNCSCDFCGCCVCGMCKSKQEVHEATYNPILGQDDDEEDDDDDDGEEFAEGQSSVVHKKAMFIRVVQD